jgi:hypothetical protein
MRAVTALRYVTPLREGGSLPALVEADDDGMYVVKFRGAGQGPKALVAELLAGEIARSVGLRVPELVLVDLDPALGRAEPDSEIRALLLASAGCNLGLDYLPGSATYDPAAGERPDPMTASRVVLFDAYVANVDRTPRNPNLLRWHGALWLIDHGAALYFHHAWTPADRLAGAARGFARIREHVLLPVAGALLEVVADLERALADERLDELCRAIPAEWLGDADEERRAYAAWLRARRAVLSTLAKEAEHARAQLV